MNKIVLDTNIYDKLANDTNSVMLLREHIHNGEIEVLVSPVIHDELKESPFKGLPTMFSVKLITEAVAVAGIAKAGLARCSTGGVFTQHCGESTKHADAVIAHTADSDADIFVSEDRRSLKRLKEASADLQCLNYEEFVAWLARSMA